MNQPELVDCHTHTVFSDGTSTLEENIVAAQAAGLSTLVCSDHWGQAPFIDCTMEVSRYEEYRNCIKAYQEQCSRKASSTQKGTHAHAWGTTTTAATATTTATAVTPEVLPEHNQQVSAAAHTAPVAQPLELVFGLEADWYPGCEEALAPIRAEVPFLLGSVHYLQGLTLDWDGDVRLWEALGANGVWERYVEEWCKAATSGLFDTMAHPDLPKIFSTTGWAPTCTLEPFYERMAQAARAGGVHIEINTAGLVKPCASMYPSRSLLEAFCRAEVPITVGSDAHSASRIGENILQAYEYAYSVGYRFVDAPCTDGTWRTISIETNPDHIH